MAHSLCRARVSRVTMRRETVRGTSTRTTRWSLAALALTGYWVCHALGSREALAQGAALPEVKVNLPPSPSFDAKHAPIRHDTGEFSVFGLRKNMTKYLDKDVQVKGYLREIYVCPEEQRKCNEAAGKRSKGKAAPALPPGECRPCDQPHFFIGDAPDVKLSRALLVADYPVKDWKTGKPRPLDDKLAKIGDLVVVTGTFAINSITGFAASNGLIIHKKLQDREGKVLLEGNAVLPPDAQTIDLEGKAPERLLQGN